MDEVLEHNHLKVKATEQYCTVLLFVMLYKVALTVILHVDEILKCDHSNKGSELYCTVLLLLCCTKLLSL